jgi:hypothetical protein
MRINATVMPEKSWICSAWKVSIPPYIFIQFELHACYTRSLHLRQFVRRYAYLQGAANSRCFRHDCGVNISCRPHVLQADSFLKIYCSIWLSQNFLGYTAYRFAYVSGEVFFGYVSGVNIGCGPHVLQFCSQKYTLIIWQSRIFVMFLSKPRRRTKLNVITGMSHLILILNLF